jgi:hypothetical protein
MPQVDYSALPTVADCAGRLRRSVGLGENALEREPLWDDVFDSGVHTRADVHFVTGLVTATR